MSEISHLFQRAKKAASRAIEAERNGDLENAFEYFLMAAEILNQMIGMERTKSIRDRYYEKAKEYLSRAKELKLLMGAQTKAADLPSPPSSPEDTPRKTPPPPPRPSTDIPKPTPPPPPRPSTDIPKPTPPPEDSMKKIMKGEDEASYSRSEDIKPAIPPPSTSRESDVSKDKPTTTPRSTPPPPSSPTTPKSPSVKPASTDKEIKMPTKTTFELLFDAGKYRDCIIECSKSVEAELRVRMGLFDDNLTLGMLLEKGIQKGMEVLKEFKFVNILLNRIEHENYRPTSREAQKAVEITTRILLS